MSCLPSGPWGSPFRYTVNGALHEGDFNLSREKDLRWILLYADDIAVMSDDPDNLRDMVAALFWLSDNVDY
jgi:hypothetical protein